MDLNGDIEVANADESAPLLITKKEKIEKSESSETKSYLWVPMALTIGALYAVADVLLSNTKSHYGFWAIGFLGPVNVAVVGIYRTI